MIMLRIATIALALGTTGTAWAQQPSDPALKNLNACLTTQRAQPSTEEEIFKSLDVAIIDPDRVAWCLFLYVNSKASSANNNDALFETWASDGETFVVNPQWPAPGQVKELRPNILLQLRDSERALQLGKQGGAIQPFVLPPPHPLKAGQNLEETRRNKVAFDFIVVNGLYKITGLQKAFAAFAQNNKRISFPADAIEVKANWFPVVSTTDPTKSGIPGFNGSPSEPHVSIM